MPDAEDVTGDSDGSPRYFDWKQVFRDYWAGPGAAHRFCWAPSADPIAVNHGWAVWEHEIWEVGAQSSSLHSEAGAHKTEAVIVLEARTFEGGVVRCISQARDRFSALPPPGKRTTALKEKPLQLGCLFWPLTVGWKPREIEMISSVTIWGCTCGESASEELVRT